MRGRRPGRGRGPDARAPRPEESETIGDLYESYLLQEGLIARTARGRVTTQRVYVQLNRTRSETLLKVRQNWLRGFASVKRLADLNTLLSSRVPGRS